MKMINVRLFVRNFDESFNFYANTMGFKVTWGNIGGDYASFEVGESMPLAIFKADLLNEYLEVEDNEPKGNDKAQLIFQCDDVDQMYARLKSKGVKFVKDIRDMTGWGIRCAAFRDPDNNLIEINSELAKDKWDKDLLELDEEYSKN